MPIGHSIRKWLRNRFGGHRRNDGHISDAWFKGHFEYAAHVIGEWLGSELKLDGAHLIDFGCGDGITALGVSLQSRPGRLIGVDIHSAFSRLGDLAKQQMGLDSLPNTLEFYQVEPGKPMDLRGMDGIYSWSVFEHVDRQDLAPIAANLLDVLRPGGIAFIQIEPLYFSAFGSHLRRVLPEPWAHLQMEPAEIEDRVRSFQGALPHEDRDLAASKGVTPEFKEWLLGEYRSLNRLTANELVELFRSVGFEIVREHRRRRPEAPPSDLFECYNEIDLTTNEILLLARKPI
jgi:SAM-dependent methyltransferase